MPVGEAEKETLPRAIRRDASTGLPLLEDEQALSQLVRSYLWLPYSVAEHGCGKKCSLILEQLVEWGVPIWALKRGMVMEADMSPEALATKESEKRREPLVVQNPLYSLGDLSQETLRDILDDSHIDVSIDNQQLSAGPFVLQHAPRVQFAIARSHIYTIVTLWDAKTLMTVERVIDPTLVRNNLFPLENLRQRVNAPEALMFTAPLAGHFRLDVERLTVRQQTRVIEYLGPGKSCDGLSEAEHGALVRHLNGAKSGTIGDPQMWTYANNIPGGDDEHDAAQQRDTGKGDALRGALSRLIEGREKRSSDVNHRVEELDHLVDRSEIHRIVRRDALWSQRQLEPLARVAITMVYYRSLCRIGETIAKGGKLDSFLETPDGHRALRGLGVRLRGRIDQLALVSEDAEGRIDARAFNERFIACALETIRQMNRAGLAVCVDRVGNLHGLDVDDESRSLMRRERGTIRRLAQNAILLGSHIDTIDDAGKFSGRLGVAGAIETAQVIQDLERYSKVRLREKSAVCLIATAFCGEEMCFTGHGISMPGSAAVSGLARVERVHDMVDTSGDRYGDRLLCLLRALRDAQEVGDIALVNEFPRADDAALLGACFEPTDFFTPHTYERHIEQGPMLAAAGIPMALVDAIMGIHQEDFWVAGEEAEAAALEAICRLRELTAREEFADTRITVGVVEAEGHARCTENPALALRCTLNGEKNHAGATPTTDRRDPVVAAGRLTRAFVEWCERARGDDAPRLEPLVGDLSVSPGTGRNVIPGVARLTLALQGAPLPEVEARDMTQTLHAFVAGVLQRDVTLGGEGIGDYRIDTTSFVNLTNSVRFSIDLRDAREEKIDACRAEIDHVMAEIEAAYGVTFRSEPQQHFPPQPIARSGQALLMERSYGGSNNPNETEMTADLTRGCILQLATVHDVLGRETLADVNLARIVHDRLPERWKEGLDHFVSGGLHDSCNIAARVLQGNGGPASADLTRKS